MKVILPDVQFTTPVRYWDMLRSVEKAGRVCYKSEDKITDESAEDFVRRIIKSGHLAVLEHASFSVKFTVDRGVSHEIVRHRMASYCQESTRFCNYNLDKFGNEITVIYPCFFELEEDLTKEERERKSHQYYLWLRACQDAEKSYFNLLAEGCTPQEARSVLPNSLKTEVVMTANIREWRHFLMQRCSASAHPQIREVARQLYIMAAGEMPAFFDDLGALIE